MLRTTQALVVLLAAVTLVASVQAAQLGFDEVPGRYQFVVADNIMYVIDTATGQCWSKPLLSKSWKNHGSPVAKRPAEVPAPPLSLRLPTDLVTLTIKQRSSRPIPGSGNRIRANLDDITGGQVILSINADRDVVLLEETSVKPGEIVVFEVNEQKFYARVKDMTNVLIGTDIAVIEIASSRDDFPAKESDVVAEKDDDDQ
jgi:hypothetical protein